jgi:hypothetical protein
MRRALVFPIVATFLLVFIPPEVNASAADRQNSPMSVPRIDAKISVDGRLDEEAWTKALVLELNYETSPGENVPALVKTEVLMMNDRGSLYFGFRCYDPDPGAIRSHFADRDRIGNDDLVNINLDTFNDERRNYYFGCNPLGVQRDGIETPTYTDWIWDGIWDCAGTITDYGYELEFSIPFTCLQFQRTNGPQIWGLDLSRWYPRSVMHRLGLVPLDRNINSYQAQFLKIQGFEGVTPGNNIEIVPTLTAIRSQAKDSPTDDEFATTDNKADVGITAAWGVTPNFTLSATANPDFSQVEADARQLDINEPFALWYAEKRPFFIEGADFFRTPLSIVYTRTFREPIWGTKLTGKAGANTVGAYFVSDDLTNLLFPGSQSSSSTSLAANSSSAVFRYKRDFGSRYTLGALLTDREGHDYYNRVLGADGLFRLTNTDQLSFQVLGSSTKYPAEVSGEFGQPADNFSDGALTLDYDHLTRSWNWSVEFEDIGADFRADMGYLPRVGYRNYFSRVYHQWIASPGKWWTNLSIGNDLNYLEDHEGALLYNDAAIWLNFAGQMQSYLQARINKGREAYNGEEFDQTQFALYGRMIPLSSLIFECQAVTGDRIDYANTRSGDRVLLYANMSVNAGKNLQMAYDHTFERMNSGGGRLYTANIGQASVVYQFNSKTFFRAILQYVDYRYNIANYTFEIEPEFSSLFSQLLFSYKLNPRTVLFLGYSDDYYGNQDFSLRQNDRTFFVKLGYSWVL